MTWFFNLLKVVRVDYISAIYIFRSIIAFLIIFVIATPTVQAEPTSTAVSISLIRTYSSGDIYITVSPTFCNTDTFHLVASDAGLKQMLAVVLSAQSNGQTVFLEAKNSTGCNGWGTELQSIYLAAAP